MNQELELYKLVTSTENAVSEFGWVNSTDFLVWLSFYGFCDFIERLNEIFGNSLFDNGGFDARIKEDYIVIDLNEILSDFIDIESIFPYEDFKH